MITDVDEWLFGIPFSNSSTICYFVLIQDHESSEPLYNVGIGSDRSIRSRLDCDNVLIMLAEGLVDGN